MAAENGFFVSMSLKPFACARGHVYAVPASADAGSYTCPLCAKVTEADLRLRFAAEQGRANRAERELERARRALKRATKAGR